MFASPEGVAIEIRGSTSMDTSIRLDVVLFRTTAPAETRDWYVKTFGAEPRSGSPSISGAGATTVPGAVLPGVTLSFAKADTAPAGTRGRGLDHIGFEVKNLEEFCKKLEAAGQKFDRPYRQAAEFSDSDCVPDRSVGHVHRADGEPRALEVRSGLKAA